MQLQNPRQTKVLIVTLAETTPVLEAAGLREDLATRGYRAVGVGDQQQCGRHEDPVPFAQAARVNEAAQIQRVARNPSQRYALPS